LKTHNPVLERLASILTLILTVACCYGDRECPVTCEYYIFLNYNAFALLQSPIHTTTVVAEDSRLSAISSEADAGSGYEGANRVSGEAGRHLMAVKRSIA
jgi:hypothetical protein